MFRALMAVRRVCLPVAYRWQATVRVEYSQYYDASTGTFRVLITKYDQSVTMFGVGQMNPCNIALGITSKGYDRWGNYYCTIRRTHPGEYIIVLRPYNGAGLHIPIGGFPARD